MVRVPTPEEEDRRRLSRERPVLLKERVQHSNRIKELLFGQGVTGYEPLRRDRRQRLVGLQTGDGRPLPPISRLRLIANSTVWRWQLSR
jgi:transposase